MPNYMLSSRSIGISDHIYYCTAQVSWTRQRSRLNCLEITPSIPIEHKTWVKSHSTKGFNRLKLKQTNYSFSLYEFIYFQRAIFFKFIYLVNTFFVNEIAWTVLFFGDQCSLYSSCTLCFGDQCSFYSSCTLCFCEQCSLYSSCSCASVTSVPCTATARCVSISLSNFSSFLCEMQRPLK